MYVEDVVLGFRACDMSKRCCLLLIVFLFFSTSCRTEEESEIEYSSYSPLVEVDMMKLDSLDIEDYVKDVEFILLETKGEAMIENIDKLVVQADHVFVFDRKQKAIFIYSLSGKFLKKISRVGKAADEYLRIDDFYVDQSGEFVYILDKIPRRVLKYNLDAKLVKSYRLVFYADSFYKLEENGGYVFAVNGNDCNDGFCDKVIFCDDNFKVVETFVPIRPRFKGFNIETPTNRLVNSSNKSFKYIDMDDMIYSFEGDTLSNVKRIDFTNNNVELSFYNAKFKDGGEFLDAVINQNKANWVHNYLENDQFIVFKYFMNRKTYSYIYSKESENGIVLRNMDSDFLAISPLFIKDDTFFEYRNPIELLGKQMNPSSSIDSLLYARLLKEFPSIDETMNPLIVKYTINTKL